MSDTAPTAPIDWYDWEVVSGDGTVVAAGAVRSDDPGTVMDTAMGSAAHELAPAVGPAAPAGTCQLRLRRRGSDVTVPPQTTTVLVV